MNNHISIQPSWNLFIMEEVNENIEADWFDELSEEQQASVLRGLDQLDKGEGISHEDAIVRLGL
jgi:predicted transcriptional regulator